MMVAMKVDKLVVCLVYLLVEPKAVMKGSTVDIVMVAMKVELWAEMRVGHLGEN